MAAEVRAASTSAASSSDDRKAGDISNVKGTTCPDVKDRHMVAKDRHPVAKDRQAVASDRLENDGERVSPKLEGKATQRRTSEVSVLSTFFCSHCNVVMHWGHKTWGVGCPLV